MKKALRKIFYRLKFLIWYSSTEKKFINTRKEKEGQIKLFNKPFNYHHGWAFHETYIEIFKKGLYTFTPRVAQPLIIDCGANMGLSVLFFSKKYPTAKIFAFEPDKKILPFLRKNIFAQNLDNVHLYEKAVWVREEILNFFTDNGMGGRLETEYVNQKPQRVEAVRLKDFLDQPVEFLKLDIEGAEYAVLEDCEEMLHNVNNIFVEYHSLVDEEQHLGDILNIFKRQNFRYHLKESFSQHRPFIDKNIICEKYDMAINIFAYKQ